MDLRNWRFVVAVVVGVVAASAAIAAEPAAPGTATIDYKGVQQVVEGFGFSTAWGSVPGDANNDAFLSVTKGAGFSIVRNRVPFRENPKIDDKFIAKANGAYTFTTVKDEQGTYKKSTCSGITGIWMRHESCWRPPRRIVTTT